MSAPGNASEPRRRRRRLPGPSSDPGPHQPLDPGRRLAAWWRAVVLAVLGAIVYANSIGSPFVFDDHGSIVENRFVRQLWPLSEATSAPVQSALAGRPVVSLSLALNHAVGGELEPAAFRRWNLAIHVLAALTLFGLVRRTLSDSRRAAYPRDAAIATAWAAAAIWLIHPLNSEVISYVTQRTESILGLLYLLTLYAAARSMASDRHAWRWWSAAISACTLGMASKESMVTAPVVVLLYDVVFWSGGPQQAFRKRWPMYAGLTCSWGVLLALNLSGPRSQSAGFSAGVSVWTYLSNQPAMVLQYLRLAFWPRELILDYGVPHELPLVQVLLSALVNVALMLATLLAWRRWPRSAFLATCFFVTLAPTSSLVPIATEVGAERRMYLPLAALVVGGTILMHRFLVLALARRPERTRTAAAIVAFSVVVSALAALTISRNVEYQSATGIWQTVLERRPHGRAHYNLAMELRERGQRSEALDHYRQALTDEPAAHYAVGFEMTLDGRHQEAIGHLREFIRLRPMDLKVPDAYVLLGRELKNTRQFGAAVDALHSAISRRPGAIDARIELADVLLKSGRYSEALDRYNELTRLTPAHPTVHSGRGISLVALGREREAIDAFARATRLQPSNAAAHYNLANALANDGRLDEAINEYRQALTLAPDAVAYRNALGLVLVARGRPREALAEFRRSMQIDPADAESREYLEAVFAGLRSTKSGVDVAAP